METTNKWKSLYNGFNLIVGVITLWTREENAIIYAYILNNSANLNDTELAKKIQSDGWIKTRTDSAVQQHISKCKLIISQLNIPDIKHNNQPEYEGKIW